MLREKSDRIVVLGHQPLAALENALAANFEVIAGWSPDAVIPPNARVLAVAGEVPLDSQLLDRVLRLEYVACVSSGHDGLDIPALHRRGLRVSVARDVNATDVADHAIGRILALYQSFSEADRLMKLGEWHAAASLPNRSVFGSRLGIVGLGAIGRAIAQRATAFGMEISWWGPSVKETQWRRAASLIELAHESDILVVAARSHPRNQKLISAEVIRALGPRGRLVNVSRGRLVDEDALLEALSHHRLAGAALDVFETEPLPVGRWEAAPNVILTPHMAGRTREALERIVDQLAENLERFFANQKLLTEV